MRSATPGAAPKTRASTVTSANLKTTGSSVRTITSGQRVMRWWLTIVARRKSEELFVLNLLLVTLALAWLTERAGLSLALGAFIAGMQGHALDLDQLRHLVARGTGNRRDDSELGAGQRVEQSTLAGIRLARDDHLDAFTQ